jgi:peroxiredoxin
LRGKKDQLEALGARVFAVSFEPPEEVRAFLEYEKQPFPILADVERRGYAAFGFAALKGWHQYKVANLSTIRVYAAGILFHGHMWRFRRHQMAQLGGNVVIDGNGIVTYVHASSDPSDRPKPEVLVEAVRRAAASPVG